MRQGFMYSNHRFHHFPLIAPLTKQIKTKLKHCRTSLKTNLQIIFLFFAGEPKIGVYMLNSGAKKLFVKVSCFPPPLFSIISVKMVRFCNPNVFLQDMQVLSKVEASLEFSQVLLRSEAKNFTEVAALTCRGELAPFYYLSHHVPNNLIIPSKCDWFSAKHLEVFSITNSFVALTRFASWG